MYVQVCMHVCAFAEASLHVFFLSCLCFETVSLTGTWGSLGPLDWMASELQGSNFLCLPSTGVTSVCHYIWLFCGFWGSNSGAYASAASTLVTELLPQPHPLHFTQLRLYIILSGCIICVQVFFSTNRSQYSFLAYFQNL